MDPLEQITNFLATNPAAPWVLLFFATAVFGCHLMQDACRNNTANW